MPGFPLSLILAAMLTALVVLVPGGEARATQMCPPQPCRAEDDNHRLNDEKCRNLSDWVATGTIRQIVHHRKGEPLNMDFAEFTLRVDSWEKAPSNQQPAEIRLRVAWCNPVLPKNISGQFRFFGSPLPADGARAQYFDFVRVQPQK